MKSGTLYSDSQKVQNSSNFEESKTDANKASQDTWIRILQANDWSQIEVIDIDNEEDWEQEDIHETAFMIYWEEMERLARQTHDFIVMDELLEQINQRWNQMTENERYWYFEVAKNRMEGEENLAQTLKKPVLPFFAFANRIRKNIKQHNPKASSKDINCAVSLAWSRVSKEEKSKLQTQYMVEKQIYNNIINQANRSKCISAQQLAYEETFDHSNNFQEPKSINTDPIN